MYRNQIRKEIINLVSSIKSQSDILANEKYPSQLDLEVFLHKVEKLYQKSIVFNHLSLFDGFEEPEQISKPALKTEPPVLKEVDTERETAQPVSPVEKTTPQAVSAVPPSVQYTSEEKKNASPPEEKQEKPVASSPRKQAPDLKSSIGINDKFQFTNELFKGNMHEFNIAIEQLNASETLELALTYMGGLKRLYGWDEENETVKRLLNLVEKRYH